MEDIEIKEEKKSSFWGGLLLGVLISGTILTIAFTVTFYSNQNKYRDLIDDLSSNVSTKGTVEENELISKEFVKKADSLYSQINANFYFEDDIDSEKMQDYMYRAIVDSLGDRYAQYYSPEEYKALFEESEGIYFGIGSYVTLDAETGYPMLSGVFEGSPAKEAGLRDGDIIAEVEGVNYYGESLDFWVSKIKGPENTTVNLTIAREDEPDFIYVTVTRAKIESPTVKYKMYEDGIGYLQITEFDDITVPQFMDAYAALENDGMTSMILDLRSNGGGNLDSVLMIADYFVPDGIIAYTLDRDGNRFDYNGGDSHEINIPMVVLTNGYTASASELLTGALKAYDKAVSIGTNTFGKGIVQGLYDLGDGSGVKLTIERYYTPDDICIHEVGIAPDIELEFDGEAYYAEESFDNQLERAKEYLLEKAN